MNAIVEKIHAVGADTWEKPTNCFTTFFELAQEE